MVNAVDAGTIYLYRGEDLTKPKKVVRAKPTVKPKLRRGNEPPPPSRRHLRVGPTVANFEVREDTPSLSPARPRYRRGDQLPPPPSGLVKAADVKEPFIKRPTREQLMSLRRQRPR
jgi:hypothetical protein